MKSLHPQRDAVRHTVCVWTIVALGLVLPGLSATAQQDSPHQVSDNGNPIDHTPFLSKERRAYGGMALAIVRSTKESGTIRVTVGGEGFAAQSVTVTTR